MKKWAYLVAALYGWTFLALNPLLHALNVAGPSPQAMDYDSALSETAWGFLIIAPFVLAQFTFLRLPLALVLLGGRLELVPVILVGTAGTVLGCWFWYGLGRWFGEVRLIRWLGRHGGRIGLNQEDVAASRIWFARHGVGLVFWGRLVPGIRTLISVPAGLEAMPMGLFLLATLAGSLLWVTLLTLLGRALGAGYGQVSQFTGPYGQISRLLLLALAGAGVIALVGRARRRRGSAAE